MFLAGLPELEVPVLIFLFFLKRKTSFSSMGERLLLVVVDDVNYLLHWLHLGEDKKKKKKKRKEKEKNPGGKSSVEKDM